MRLDNLGRFVRKSREGLVETLQAGSGFFESANGGVVVRAGDSFGFEREEEGNLQGEIARIGAV